jgi:hypothetical protein
MRWSRAGLFLATVIMIADPARAVAQGQDLVIPQGYAVGLTGDLWIFAVNRGYATPMATLRLSGLHRGGITPEFAVGVAPLVALESAVLVQPDLDLAYNISLPGMSLLLAAGVSAVLQPEAGSLGRILGGNIGLSALASTAEGHGVRVNGAFRPLFDSGGMIPTFSFGLGITTLPKGGR